MKLRLRSLETKQTLKIQVPVPCSLLQLKHIIVSATSSSPPGSSVHLSLNRTDELVGSDPRDNSTLQSLGITSGDLIFYTLNPNAFSISQLNNNTYDNNNSNSNSRETLVVGPPPGGELSPNGTLNSISNTDDGDNLRETLVVGPGSVKESPSNETLNPEFCREKAIRQLGSDDFAKNIPRETVISESSSGEKLTGNHEPGANEILESNSGKEGITTDQTMVEGTEAVKETINMDVDGDDDDDDVADVDMGKGFSVPNFLKKVFNKELADSRCSDRQLVVIAIHAVLSESGFVGYNSISKTKIEGFYLPDMWPSSGSSISLHYTLPELVRDSPGADATSSDSVETVTLKVQSLGKYVNIYGSLSGKNVEIYRVCLDEERLAFLLNLMWANLESVHNVIIGDTVSSIFPEKDVFEFWRTVKDKLSLPLLIDICEKSNLPPPPCFDRLPTDLKLKVMELLPGADVAKMACVSPELRFLSSYDDIWKKKFAEQFGNAEVAGESGRAGFWKRKFATSWEAKKRRNIRMPHPHHPLWVPRINRDRRQRPRWFAPRIIGGDYDLGPDITMGGGHFRSFGERNDMFRSNFGGGRF